MLDHFGGLSPNRGVHILSVPSWNTNIGVVEKKCTFYEKLTWDFDTCTYVYRIHTCIYIYIYLVPQTTSLKWMFGETTISYVKILNHPIETTIYKWLFGVPGIYIYLYIIHSKSVSTAAKCFLHFPHASWICFPHVHLTKNPTNSQTQLPPSLFPFHPRFSDPSYASVVLHVRIPSWS